MLPHPDRITATVELRRADFFREVARERLTATAVRTSVAAPAHSATSNPLHAMLARLGALLGGTKECREAAPALQGR
jgi:hypothetical protein